MQNEEKSTVYENIKVNARSLGVMLLLTLLIAALLIGYGYYNSSSPSLDMNGYEGVAAEDAAAIALGEEGTETKADSANDSQNKTLQ